MPLETADDLLTYKPELGLRRRLARAEVYATIRDQIERRDALGRRLPGD